MLCSPIWKDSNDPSTPTLVKEIQQQKGEAQRRKQERERRGKGNVATFERNCASTRIESNIQEAVPTLLDEHQGAHSSKAKLLKGKMQIKTCRKVKLKNTFLETSGSHGVEVTVETGGLNGSHREFLEAIKYSKGWRGDLHKEVPLPAKPLCKI